MEIVDHSVEVEKYKKEVIKLNEDKIQNELSFKQILKEKDQLIEDQQNQLSEVQESKNKLNKELSQIKKEKNSQEVEISKLQMSNTVLSQKLKT